MDHYEQRERLDAYVLGALDAAEAAAGAAHVERGESGGAEAAAGRGGAEGLRAALEVASPLRGHPSVKRRVLAAVQGPPRPRHFRPQLWPVAAAVALLMFIGSTV